MKTKHRTVAVVGFVTLFAHTIQAQGSLTPPESPAPSMHTLDEIYQKVENLAPQDLKTLSDSTTSMQAGYYAATTLDTVDSDLVAGNIKEGVSIFGVAGNLATPLPAPVSKTGQTTSYASNDDGALEKGVAWPSPRFTNNSDGTITDNLTGLVWLKNANAFGISDWASALSSCAALNSGEHGLTDGSIEGDWRLPNIHEMLSLLSYGYYSPCLCNTPGTSQWTAGDPFTDVQSATYWSSTTHGGSTANALHATLSGGFIGATSKTSTTRYVWPVRDAN